MPNLTTNIITLAKAQGFDDISQKKPPFTSSLVLVKHGENDNKSSLEIAMDKLANALDEQRIASQEFKKNTSDLKSEILAMENHLIEYQTILTQIKVDPLRRKSIRLARIMDSAI